MPFPRDPPQQDGITAGRIDTLLDIDRIKELVDMMVANDLLELSLRNGDVEVSLRRPGHNSSEAVTVTTNPDETADPSDPAAEDEAAVEMKEISSPMVGTFYAGPDPESPPFVQAGSRVHTNTVICIVEAMKVFNELKAEINGTIVKTLVKNEQTVEYGQPLFLVRPD